MWQIRDSNFKLETSALSRISLAHSILWSSFCLSPLLEAKVFQKIQMEEADLTAFFSWSLLLPSTPPHSSSWIALHPWEGLFNVSRDMDSLSFPWELVWREGYSTQCLGPLHMLLLGHVPKISIGQTPVTGSLSQKFPWWIQLLRNGSRKLIVW